MRRIVLVLFAVGALTGLTANSARYLDRMEMPPRSSQASSPPDIVTGG